MITKRAIFVKGDVLSALTLEIGQFGSVRVCRFDPRASPAVERGPWDFLACAEKAYGRSKTTSKARGWVLVYEGPPLKG